MSPGLVRGVAGTAGITSSSGSAGPFRITSISPEEKPVSAEVEIDVEHRQLAELELQEIEVPAGAERDLVVGDPERALLRLREMRQHDRRHLGHPQRLRRQQPAVAGDDRALGIDQDRVGEAELPDRGGDLLDLALRMGAGVAGIGDQAGDRPVADRQRSRRNNADGHAGPFDRAAGHIIW